MRGRLRTVGGRLPDVNLGFGEGIAAGIPHNAVHESHVGIFGRVEADGGAVVADGVIFAVEGSQNGGGGDAVGALGGRCEGDVVDEANNSVSTDIIVECIIGSKFNK